MAHTKKTLLRQWNAFCINWRGFISPDTDIVLKTWVFATVPSTANGSSYSLQETRVLSCRCDSWKCSKVCAGAVCSQVLCLNKVSRFTLSFSSCNLPDQKGLAAASGNTSPVRTLRYNTSGFTCRLYRHTDKHGRKLWRPEGLSWPWYNTACCPWDYNKCLLKWVEQFSTSLCCFTLLHQVVFFFVFFLNFR